MNNKTKQENKQAKQRENTTPNETTHHIKTNKKKHTVKQ